MAIKLSELFAKVLRLESHLADEARQELKDFKAAVTEQVNQIQSDLLTAQTSLKTIGNEKALVDAKVIELSAAVTGINNNLDGAISALKLELKSDATAAEKISAIQGAVASTLSKLSVPPSAIPSAKASDSPRADSKTLSLKDFNALTPQQKMAFSREVGIGAAKLVE